LLIRHVDLSLDVELVRQVQAFLFLDAEAEAIELFFELIESLVADDLLEAMACQASLYDDRVPCLECVV